MQHFRQEATKYLVLNRILYWRRRTNESPAKVLVSEEENKKAIEATHELSGHRGREGTLRKVAEHYWWPEMYADVIECLKTCEQCEKRVPLRYNEPLKSLTVSYLWQYIGIDIFYMPKMEKGFHLLVTSHYYPSW